MDILLYCYILWRLRHFNRALLSLLCGFLGMITGIMGFPVFAILLGVTALVYGYRYKKVVFSAKNMPDHTHMPPDELKFARIGIILGGFSMVYSIIYCSYLTAVLLKSLNII